jgi:hypothetical protein
MVRDMTQQDDEPVLLSGGNPQIGKGDGDHVVQRYIAAMPDWKHDVGVHLDALITDTVPQVFKGVRWNSPFYGLEGEGWFISFHCLTKYIKVAFFQGASLQPAPPIESKDEHTRYLHVFEGDDIDDAQLTAWIGQAAALPGWGKN